VKYQAQGGGVNLNPPLAYALASLFRHSSHCKPYQRSDDSELPLKSADSGNSDYDRDSSMDSDAARENVSSEVHVPPVSCESNAVPSERFLRPRCNPKLVM